MDSKQFKNTHTVTIHDSSPLSPLLPYIKANGVPTGHGVFFTVNGCKGRRLKTNLCNLNGIFADFDYKNGVPPLKQFQEDIDELPHPTYINRSKNGFHCLWMMEDSIIVTDDNRESIIETVEGIHARITKDYGSDAKANDVLHLLRIPKYEHRKDPKNPFIVETVVADEEQRFTLEELTKLIPPLPKPEKKEFKPTVNDGSPVGQVNAMDIRQVVIDVWKSKGHEASFDSYDRLILDNKATATFVGRQNEGNYIATTSTEYPYQGNHVTYTAGVLGVNNKEAFAWLRKQYIVEDVPINKPPPPENDELDWETLQYEDKKLQNGDTKRTYLANLENLFRIIRHYKICKYDTFKCRHYTLIGSEWKVRADEIDMAVYSRIANEFCFMAKVNLKLIEKAMSMLAMENQYDSAKDYVESLEWDGVARLDDWISKVYRLEPHSYYTEVGANWWKGMVKRMIDPGSKFDHALIIKGGQGFKKSTVFLEIVAGFANSINSVEFTDVKVKQFQEDIQGMLIAEFAEGAVFKKSDQETIKSIITRQTDRFRVPYETHSRDFPRRCVFAVTTNKDELLKDSTGNRRWWPIDIGDYSHVDSKERPHADSDWIIENRDQLFAEAHFRLTVLKEEYWNVDEEELMKRQLPFEAQYDDADLYIEYYEKLSNEEKEAGVTARDIFNGVFSETDTYGKTKNNHMGINVAMAIANVLQSKNGLDLEKKRKKRGNYYYPRNPLKDFTLALPVTKHEEPVTVNADDW